MLPSFHYVTVSPVLTGHTSSYLSHITFVTIAVGCLPSLTRGFPRLRPLHLTFTHTSGALLLSLQHISFVEATVYRHLFLAVRSALCGFTALTAISLYSLPPLVVCIQSHRLQVSLLPSRPMNYLSIKLYAFIGLFAIRSSIATFHQSPSYGRCLAVTTHSSLHRSGMPVQVQACPSASPTLRATAF